MSLEIYFIGIFIFNIIGCILAAKSNDNFDDFIEETLIFILMSTVWPLTSIPFIIWSIKKRMGK